MDISEQKDVENLWLWNYSGNDDVWYRAYAPNSIQLLLEQDTLLVPLFYGDEFKVNYWPDTVSWKFRSTIAIPKEVTNEHYELHFDGMVGQGSIYLNDSLIADQKTMFTKKITDVTKLLKKGNNELLIIFDSFRDAKMQANKNSSIRLPFSGLEMLRLANYMVDTTRIFYVPIGLWQGVYLKKWEDFFAEDLYFEVNEIGDSSASLTAHLTIKSDITEEVNVKIYDTKATYVDKNIELQENKTDYQIKFDVKKPELWWPYELGEPNLYDFVVNIQLDKDKNITLNKNVGIRKIEVDTAQNRFDLKVNGVPLRLKIIDYLPSSFFLNSVEALNYELTVKNIKKANLNMIHVLENGIYEKENLYSECDKNGVLVWQDIMLPYKIVDDDQDFITNFQEETTLAVRRLRNYASIAFWSGQNDFEQYWHQNAENMSYSEADSVKIRKTNKHIFGEIIPQIITNNSQQQYFEKIKSPYVKSIDDNLPEFPHIATFRKHSAEVTRKIDEEHITSHQISPDAIQKINKKINVFCSKKVDFSSFTYLSQLLALKNAENQLEKMRFSSDYSAISCGQYRDFAPFISCSAVDFYNYKKGKFYGIKRGLEKLLIDVQETGGNVEVKLNSEFSEDQDVDFYFKLYDFNGKIHWRNNQLGRIIEKSKSKVYFNFNLNNELERIGRNFLVLKIDLYLNQELYAEKLYYFTSDKYLKLKKPEIKQKFYKLDEGYAIELTSDYLAKNVYLYTENNGVLSDNFFDIIPGETKKIICNTAYEIVNIESTFIPIDFTKCGQKNIFMEP